MSCSALRAATSSCRRLGRALTGSPRWKGNEPSPLGARVGHEIETANGRGEGAAEMSEASDASDANEVVGVALHGRWRRGAPSS